LDKNNIKKLEEEAFNTIDDIFSDDEDEDDGFLYDGVENNNNDSNNNNIERLEEKLLSLDWEFSSKDMAEVCNIITALQQQYDDNISKILLTMMANISKFIMNTKERAPANSLSLLAQVLDTFKKVSDDQLDDNQKKEKLKRIYGIFKIFKQELYVKRKHVESKGKDKPGKIPVTDLQEKEKQNLPPTEPLQEEIAVSEADIVFDDETSSLSDQEILQDEEIVQDEGIVQEEVKSVDTGGEEIMLFVDESAGEQTASLEYGSEISARLLRLEKKVDFIISTLKNMTSVDIFENEHETDEMEYDGLNDTLDQTMDDSAKDFFQN
jgi:hypothetical protein